MLDEATTVDGTGEADRSPTPLDTPPESATPHVPEDEWRTRYEARLAALERSIGEHRHDPPEPEPETPVEVTQETETEITPLPKPRKEKKPHRRRGMVY